MDGPGEGGPGAPTSDWNPGPTSESDIRVSQLQVFNCFSCPYLFMVLCATRRSLALLTLFERPEASTLLPLIAHLLQLIAQLLRLS